MAAKLFALFFLASLLLAPVVSAQNTATKSARDRIESVRKEIKDTRSDIKNTFKENRATTSATFKDRMNGLLPKPGSGSADFKKLILERKASMSAIRDARKEAMKQMLLKFKDQRKAVIAERIDGNLNAINERHTTNMTQHLDKMTVILDKMQTKLGTASASASSSAALASASASIETAKNAVATQAGKDYTVALTTEGKLAADVKIARDKLFNDLKATHELVVAARKALGMSAKTIVAQGGVRAN